MSESETPTPPGRTVQEPGMLMLLVHAVYAADRRLCGIVDCTNKKQRT